MKVLHIAISRGHHALIQQTAELIEYQALNNNKLEISAIVLEDSFIKAHLVHSRAAIDIATIKHHQSPTLLLKIWSRLSSHRHDIVHIHGNNGQRLLGAALSFYRHPLKVVLSTRDKPRIHFANRIFFRHLSVAITPNRLTRDNLVKPLGYEVKCRIIAPAIDTDRFRPEEEQCQSIPVIGMFARYDEIKGYPHFFEACRKLYDNTELPPFKVVISGKDFDRCRDEIESELEAKKLKGKITLLKGQRDVAADIRKIDIGVIASIGSEELSRIAMEYMSCGIPVVATKVGSLAEIVSADTGLLVEPCSPDELYRALALLLRDEALRARLGKAAREKMINHYSKTVVYPRIEALYSELLS